MGDWLTGLVSGFGSRREELEARNYQEGIASRDREMRVLNALSQSDDPEVRHLAVAGLLESAGPAKKKGGFRGWMGELAQSPALAQIRALSPMVEQTVQETKPILGPPAQQGYIPQAPPVVGGAAQAPTSPTQGAPLETPRMAQDTTSPEVASGTVKPLGVAGAPNALVESPFRENVQTPRFSAGAVATPPPEVRDLGAIQPDMRPTPPPSVEGIVTSRQQMVPRQFLPTQEDLALRQSRARSVGAVQGQVEGLVAAGVSRPEAIAMVKSKMEREARGGGAPYQAVAGETFNEDTGQWESTYGTFDKQHNIWLGMDGQPLTTFRKVSAAAQGRSLYGTEANTAAASIGFKTAQEAIDAGKGNELTTAITNLRQQKSFAGTTGTNLANAAKPLTPAEKFDKTRELSDKWTKYTENYTIMNQKVGQMDAAMRQARLGNLAPAVEALTVTFQKVLDPPSVVREGEAQRPGEFQPLINRAEAIKQRLMSVGGAIPLSELQGYVDVAKDMTRTVGQLTEGERQRIGYMADQFGLDQKMIFSPSAPGGGPAPGTQPILGTPPPAPPGAAAPASAAPTTLNSPVPPNAQGKRLYNENGAMVWR